MTRTARIARPGWLHRPRPTVRLRLTLMYGAAFFVAGAVLLALTSALVIHGASVVAVPAPAGGGVPPTTVAGSFEGGSQPLPTPPALASIQQLQQYAAQLHADAVAQITADRAATNRNIIVQSGLALALMSLAAMALGRFLAGRVLRPLRTMTAGVHSITATSLHERLALDGPDDELRDLGGTFNGLLDRLEASFAAQRQFVANASHELRSPLARQRTLLEVSLGDPDATVQSLRATAARVLAAGEQQERLIDALLVLARSERGIETRRRLDLAAIAGECILDRRPAAEHRGIRVDAELEPAFVAGDARLLERLVGNLLDNALRHNVQGGRVTVRTGQSGDRALLEMTNTGPIVPPEEVEGLFDPFRRLADERTGHGDGLGLGLSIVRAVAIAHGGDVSARALPDGGLLVQVLVPAAPAEASEGSVSGRAG